MKQFGRKSEKKQKIQKTTQLTTSSKRKAKARMTSSRAELTSSKSVLLRATPVLFRTTNLKKSMTSNICFTFTLFRVLESFYLGNLANFIFRGVNILGYKTHPEFRSDFNRTGTFSSKTEKIRYITQLMRVCSIHTVYIIALMQ